MDVIRGVAYFITKPVYSKTKHNDILLQITINYILEIILAQTYTAGLESDTPIKYKLTGIARSPEYWLDPATWRLVSCARGFVLPI